MLIKLIDKFILVQFFSDRNNAVPDLIHFYPFYLVGIYTNITKLVLCPVVLNTPFLASVLYIGHR